MIERGEQNLDHRSGTPMISRSDALEIAREFVITKRLETVRVIFTDMHGVVRGKVLQAQEYLHHAASGLRFCGSVLAKDVTGRTVPAAGRLLGDRGGDEIALPDPSTYRTVPWHRRTGQVIADLTTIEGTPLPHAPRSVLRRVAARAAEQRVVAHVGAELEFYLLSANARQPVLSDTQPLDLVGLSSPDRLLDKLVSALSRMELPLEAIHREGGPGQFEISLRHGLALETADHVVVVKNAVKEIARTHGLLATFMAKPFGTMSGSGLHLHHSLWDAAARTNLFSAPHPGQLSDEAAGFIAGQLRHLPAAMALFAPFVNSYKRLHLGGAFAPKRCNWGFDNRSVALRVPETTGSGSRVEHRAPGADSNPYLAVAASLGSGLLGIEARARPAVPEQDDSGATSNAPLLPASLNASLAAALADPYFTRMLGRQVLELFAALKGAECEAYERHVTDWERTTYLELA